MNNILDGFWCLLTEEEATIFNLFMDKIGVAKFADNFEGIVKSNSLIDCIPVIRESVENEMDSIMGSAIKEVKNKCNLSNAQMSRILDKLSLLIELIVSVKLAAYGITELKDDIDDDTWLRYIDHFGILYQPNDMIINNFLIENNRSNKLITSLKGINDEQEKEKTINTFYKNISTATNIGIEDIQESLYRMSVIESLLKVKIAFDKTLKDIN